MKITMRQLRRIIREEAGPTEKEGLKSAIYDYMKSSIEGSVPDEDGEITDEYIDTAIDSLSADSKISAEEYIDADPHQLGISKLGESHHKRLLLKRSLRQHIRHILGEEREALKDTLEHDDPTDVIHAFHQAWEGGEAGEEEQENLIMPIDYTDVATGENTVGILDDESMELVEESYGESHAPLDWNGDTFLTPEELYAHFDLDGDGIVSVEDYVAHVRWHCQNPDAFAKEGIGDEVSDEVMYFVLDNLGLTNQAELDGLDVDIVE